jgi:hypothetical protein
MNGTGWAAILVIAGVAALIARAISKAKPARPSITPPPPEPVGPIKVMLDGEEVELEPMTDEELDRLALEAKEEKPETTDPERALAEDWRDVMADAGSVSRRRQGGAVVDLKTASLILAKAGIPCRVAVSQDSLLGLRTLQVREPDFDRARETLRSADEKA